MTQSRSIRQFGGYTALLALLLQFALSFGHLHKEEVFGPAGLRVITTRSVLAEPHASGTVDPHDVDMPADGCAICAVMAMVASSIVPDTLDIPKLCSTGLVPVFAGTGFLISEPGYRLFQTRAPPGMLND